MTKRLRSSILLVVLLSLLGTGVLAASPAAATEYPGQGTITGTITDASGAVSNALVVFAGEHNNLAHIKTAADGSYSVDAWPDNYSVGVEPPSGSSDGYATESGIVVTQGVTTQVNVVLPSTQGTAQLSGIASYADKAPDAGVEVNLFPLDFKYEAHSIRPLITDEQGHWDAGQTTPGTYLVSYTVNTGTSKSPAGAILAQEYLMLGPGTKVLTKTLNGPKPDATLYVNIESPEGIPDSKAPVEISPAGSSTREQVGPTATPGRFRVLLPSGSYVATAGDESEHGHGSAAVSVSNGQISEVSIKLQRQPLTVPAGTVSHRTAQELEWLNAQRARWALPAGLINVPEWSQACGAHDAYEALNKEGLTHFEQLGKPGFSVGGAWAGEHSILAGDGNEGWNLEENPWLDAPIHLDQLFTPALQVVGLDDSHGNQCVTTWPGMTRVPPPRGTVFTFPGDGTTGLPPAEDAEELPTVPGKEVGITGLAGRELFVYEQGTGVSYCQPLNIDSASLQSSSGPAEVRWVDQTGGLGGYLTGGIIIPVNPLKPYTTYTATVTLEPLEEICGLFTKEEVGQITHQWSFTTGEYNPGGSWGSKPRTPEPPSLIIGRKGIWARIRGSHFTYPGVVTLTRNPGHHLIKTLHVAFNGHFSVRIRWGRKRLRVSAEENGTITKGSLWPLRTRHHHHHRRPS